MEGQENCRGECDRWLNILMNLHAATRIGILEVTATGNILLFDNRWRCPIVKYLPAAVSPHFYCSAAVLLLVEGDCSCVWLMSSIFSAEARYLVLQTLQYTAPAAAQTLIDYCKMQLVFLHFLIFFPDRQECNICLQ